MKLSKFSLQHLNQNQLEDAGLIWVCVGREASLCIPSFSTEVTLISGQRNERNSPPKLMLVSSSQELRVSL
jgi:hypothetical protein